MNKVQSISIKQVALKLAKSELNHTKDLILREINMIHHHEAKKAKLWQRHNDLANAIYEHMRGVER